MMVVGINMGFMLWKMDKFIFGSKAVTTGLALAALTMLKERVTGCEIYGMEER